MHFVFTDDALIQDDVSVQASRHQVQRKFLLQEELMMSSFMQNDGFRNINYKLCYAFIT